MLSVCEAGFKAAARLSYPCAWLASSRLHGPYVQRPSWCGEGEGVGPVGVARVVIRWQCVRGMEVSSDWSDGQRLLVLCASGCNEK